MRRVYFMKPIGMAGPVKIGCSITPENRLRSLDIWSPFPLELVVSAPGGNCEENRLHWRFRESRSHGEWFFVTPELLSVIDFVRLNGTLPPLEAVPPKARKTKLSGPNRCKAISDAKRRFSLSIRGAERHAYGDIYRDYRPQWIKDAVASWQGQFVPYPSDELVAKIETYKAELLSRPKETRGWRELWNIRDKLRAERAAA